jgi:hypothetical protein
MRDEVLARLPLLARVALAGEGEGALELLPVDRLGRVGLVLLNDGEEVPEQGALVGGELLGDRVRAEGPRASIDLADARVPAGLRWGLLDGGLTVALYVGCGLSRRNRIASTCLARQAA